MPSWSKRYSSARSPSAVGALSLVSQHVINLWFVNRRGMAAAAASLGLALGGVFFPPLINTLIQGVGWRDAYIVLGLLVGGTMVPIGLLLFRDRPERFGLAPDLGTQVHRLRLRPEPAFTRAQAIRTGVFWTLSFANVMSNALGTGLLLNHFDLLARIGVPREAAVFAFAPLSLAQVLAVVAMGPLVDRMTPHRLIVVPMVSMASACLLVGAITSTAGAFVYAVVLGLALGGFQAINTAVYAHHYGRLHLGEIRGLTFVITIVGAALGPLPFGWASAQGSYFPILFAGVVLCSVAAAANLVVTGPRDVTSQS